MTIRTALEAVSVARATLTNRVGFCQQVVRGYYNAPSVGDVDGDGRSDAEDGWKSEPEWARNPGDRNPPLGAPLAFLGGRNDDGHRAIIAFEGEQPVRSTDMFDGAYTPGVTGNCTIADIERSMGVVYAGWTRTISGLPIEFPAPPPPPKPEQTLLNKGRQYLKKARDRAIKHGKIKRARTIQKALDILPKK